MKSKCCPKCDHRFRRAVYDKNGKLLRGTCGFCGFTYNSSVKDVFWTNKELIKC